MQLTRLFLCIIVTFDLLQEEAASFLLDRRSLQQSLCSDTVGRTRDSFHVSCVRPALSPTTARIRWNLPFKPDESVEIYGNKDDDDDAAPEEPKEEESDSERLEFMAVFLVNRLGRAYLRNKLQSMRESDQAKTAVEKAKSFNTLNESEETNKAEKLAEPAGSKFENTQGVTAESDVSSEISDTEVLEGKAGNVFISGPAPITEEVEAVGDKRNEDVATEASVDVVADTDGAENISDTKLEKTEVKDIEKAISTKEGISSDEATDSVETPGSELKADAASDAADTMAAFDTEKGSVQIGKDEGQSDDNTVEVPSLAHEKEGDRNIGLKDEFVDKKGIEAVDEESGHSTGEAISFPPIPKEISMEFGRPLQVVQDGLPPIRS